MLEYTFAIRELAVAHGDKNIYQFSKRLGVTYSRAKKLWHGEEMTKIGKDTISLLCEAFSCTPNDFIKPLAPVGGRTSRKSATRPKAT